MDTLISLLLLLGLIILSNILQKRIPALPIPLIQIAMGTVLGALFGVTMQLDYKLFMILFIAPILFMSGKSLSKDVLLKYKAPLFESVILVFVTVLACGALLRLLIPDMPYAVCFALAAALSPTDSAVISEISKRIKLPDDLKAIIKGESLINDVMGIVLFNFAIAAALTDTFTFGTAVVNFIFVILGGIVFAVPVSIIILFVSEKLKDMGIEDATVFTLIQILTPFLLYYGSSELGLSGATAVVSGGIVYSVWPKKKRSLRDFNIGLVADGAWSTLIFVLTGLIYLFLGLNLPFSIQNALQANHLSTLSLVWYSAAVFAVLAITRFVYSLAVFGRHSGRRFHHVALSHLSGPRGAITLAACLSIPLLLDDGSPFPYRHLLLFIGSVIIIATLLLSSFVLPLIAPKQSRSNLEVIHNANRQLLRTVIERLRLEITEENRAAMYSVISHYENLLSERYSKEKAPRREVTRADVLLFGIAVELKEVERLRRSGGYDEAALRRVRNRLYVVQKRFGRKIAFFTELRYNISALIKHETHVDQEEVAKIKMITIAAAIAAIEANINRDNRAMSMSALYHYSAILETYTNTSQSDEGHVYVEMRRGLDYKAIQLQKSIVQKMLEDNEISRSTYVTLRHVIRLAEIAFLTSVDRNIELGEH